MRALIQRVSSASVSIDGACSATIGKGMVILLGIAHADSESDSVYVANRCVNLRIFEDDSKKMNLSLKDVGGEALIISQFTLYADTRKGCRPGFSDAATPEHANPIYEHFIDAIRLSGVDVATGQFGAMMDVNIVNHGPVTVMLESK